MQRVLSMTGLVVALAMSAAIPGIRALFRDRTKAHSRTVGQSQPDTSAAWQTLLLFENQNLSKLAKPEREKIQRTIDALVGKRENQLRFPWFLKKISEAKGLTRYALIEESPLITIPGNSGMSVHIFGPNGALIRSFAFETGWRIAVTDIRVAHLRQIDRDVIEVRSEPVINGRDVAKQFYALVNDDVLLIRLEDKAGHLVRNAYGAPNHTFGFAITGRSANDWEQTLVSDDPAEVLATLTWLSGTHLDPKEPLPVPPTGWPEISHEELAEARTAGEVRSRESVQRRLKTLLASENLWVRQAANLARKSEDYSWGIRIK